VDKPNGSMKHGVRRHSGVMFSLSGIDHRLHEMM